MTILFLRKYGVATTIDFSLYKADGTALKTDAVSASGDVTLYRDEQNVETLDADAFVDEGAIYSLVLSATEMEAARIIICIVDQTSPQAWFDRTLIVETYGHASAQHAFDLDTATVNLSSTTETQIDNIETDTNEIQGKLPTNKFMGSSDGSDKDDEIDAIKAKTDNLPADPASETNVDANETKIDTLQADATAIKAKTDNLPADPADESNIIAEIDANETKIDALQTDLTAVKAKTDNLPADPASETNVDANETKIDTIDANVDSILKINKNRWKIDVAANTLTIYDDDGVTPLHVFNLKDSAGNPASTNVFERAP